MVSKANVTTGGVKARPQTRAEHSGRANALHPAKMIGVGTVKPGIKNEKRKKSFLLKLLAKGE